MRTAKRLTWLAVMFVTSLVWSTVSVDVSVFPSKASRDITFSAPCPPVAPARVAQDVITTAAPLT